MSLALPSAAPGDPSERPCIFVCSTDMELLLRLLPEVSAARGEAAALLSEELDRAEVCEPRDMPARVVRLGSKVRFRDLGSGRERTIRLVAPADVDTDHDQVSILTPIGAALIGLPQDQVFSWVSATGALRSIVVLEVLDDFVFR